MTDRKKPGVAFWATVAVVVVLVVLMAYPLSFGPASRLAQRRKLPEDAFVALYRPIGWLACCGPRPMRIAIWRWLKFWNGEYIVEDLAHEFIPDLRTLTDHRNEE
jgi:hypothetical protein